MSDTNARDADAVRYAVLQRLASGMRHTLMAELQSIQFAAELAARMQANGVTGPRLAECLDRMSAQTHAAIDSARSIVEWLRPDDKATTTLDEALRRCLRIAGDDWSLRGIEASTDVRTGDTLVAKAALHELLVTSLFALIDTHPGPLDIEVKGGPAGEDVIVSLRAKPAARQAPFPALSIHRAVTCDDVVTVGTARGIACTPSDGTMTLRLRAVPPVA